MKEYRVTLETLMNCWEYVVEAPDAAAAEALAVELAVQDEMPRWHGRYVKVEAL
jgi:hypothetical protein